jgi:hypothetical protein
VRGRVSGRCPSTGIGPLRDRNLWLHGPALCLVAPQSVFSSPGVYGMRQIVLSRGEWDMALCCWERSAPDGHAGASEWQHHSRQRESRGGSPMLSEARVLLLNIADGLNREVWFRVEIPP